MRAGRSSDSQAAYSRAFPSILHDSGLCGFVPGHGGGTVPESHGVPYEALTGACTPILFHLQPH